MIRQIPLPPPFTVGESYEDEQSEYKVVSVEGSRMTFERPDGAGGYTVNIALKAAIHRRRMYEQEHPGARKTTDFKRDR